MNPLRAGLLVGDDVSPEESAPLIDCLNAHEAVSMQFIAIAGPGATSNLSQRCARPSRLLYVLYAALDRRRVRHQLPAPNRHTTHSTRPAPETVRLDGRALATATLRRLARNLDVLIVFGAADSRGLLDCSPTYGIWTCWLGDSERFRTIPAGFWEVHHDLPASAVTLEVQTDAGAERAILERRYCRTDLTSPHRNRRQLALLAASLLEDALNRLRRAPLTPEQFCVHLRAVARAADTPLGPPGVRDLLAFLRAQMKRLIARRRQARAGHEQWSVGLIRKPRATLTAADLASVEWYLPDATHFLADPFVVVREGETFVFAEDYDRARGRGHISLQRVTRTGLSAPVPVLQRDFHLSFPFLLEFDGALYMLPEQAASGEIALYECVRFPDQWCKRCTLVADFAGLDNVLYFHHDKWWLFTTRYDVVSGGNNLHLFHSGDLFSGFVPHPLNPVRSSLYGARMAGAVFTRDGRIIRPAQNGTHRYGGAIVYQEILTLTEQAFEERTVGELVPDARSPFGRALHTINGAGDLTVIDGARLVRGRNA